MSGGQKLSYQALSEGRLLGVLKWPHFETLWAYLGTHPDGWYVWDLQKPDVPEQTLGVEQFRSFLEVSEAYLRDRHRVEHFGVIYTDNLEAPSFMKIYDPKNMGSACNTSGEPVAPRWIVSLVKPIQITAAPLPPKKGFRRFFQRA